MKYMWSYEFPHLNASMWNYTGIFTESGNNIVYLHYTTKSIVTSTFNIDGQLDDNAIYSSDEKIALPSQWELMLQNGKKHLIFSKNRMLDIDGHKIISADDLGIKEEDKYDPNVIDNHFSEDDFVFGNTVIEHISELCYRCRDRITKEIKWRVSLKGYLYSDIINYGDMFLFFTAGHGGGIFAVDSLTGEIKYYLNTGGTYKYIKDNSNIYCYRYGKHSALLKVDLDSGKILEELPLPGIANECSPMNAVFDSYILTLTFNHFKNKSYTYNPTVSCIKIR